MRPCWQLIRQVKIQNVKSNVIQCFDTFSIIIKNENSHKAILLAFLHKSMHTGMPSNDIQQNPTLLSTLTFNKFSILIMMLDVSKWVRRVVEKGYVWLWLQRI